MSASSCIMALLLSTLAVAVFLATVHAKPSVPEFTVKLVAHPYDVPTTYSTDPYTGETITHEGYHVENKSIEVWIKNQPFVPYDDEEGHEVNLYYNVRYKGHFEEDWTELYSPFESLSTSKFPVQSSSEYTVLSIPAVYPFFSGAQVDFQVEAILGHYYYQHDPNHPLAPSVPAFDAAETSGWSDTQTLTIGERQTPTPYQEQEIIIGAAVTAAVIVAFLGLIIYLIKRK